jgi:hypothetical protein
MEPAHLIRIKLIGLESATDFGEGFSPAIWDQKNLTTKLLALGRAESHFRHVSE